MSLSFCAAIFTNEQGRELASHGTPSFPCASYRDDLAVESVPWHWHEELELIIITEGEMNLTIGSDKYTVSRGDGVFINTGVLHEVKCTETQNCILHSLVFHPRLIGGSMDSVFWQKYLNPILSDSAFPLLLLRQTLSWHKEALNLLSQAWRFHAEEPAGYEFQVRELLSRLIYLIFLHRPVSSPAISEKSLRNSQRIKDMLLYIHENYSEDLTISRIAASASLSKSECLRCFKHTIGITPIQYVKQYRIQKAAQLLTSTSLKIVDIGIQCGFQEMSYFAKIFKEIHGCTPSEYRKNTGSPA